MAGMVPDIQIDIAVNGRGRSLHYRKVPFKAWPELKAGPGFTPQTLVDGIANGDVEAGMALLWLERRQREKTLKWSTFFLDFEDDEDLEVLGIRVQSRWVFGDPADREDAPEIPDETEADPTAGS